MRSNKYYFFLLALALIVLVSCSRRYTGELMNNASQLELAAAQELPETTIEPEVKAREEPSFSSRTVEANQKVKADIKMPADERKNIPVPTKVSKLVAKVKALPAKAVNKAAEGVASAITVSSAAKAPPRNEQLVAIGVIMALSGTAAALILGFWLAPEIGTLVFMWMALALFIAFMGFFIAMLGVAYGWDVEDRFEK